MKVTNTKRGSRLADQKSDRRRHFDVPARRAPAKARAADGGAGPRRPSGGPLAKLCHQIFKRVNFFEEGEKAIRRKRRPGPWFRRRQLAY
ncbi:hypothetical protein EVAR_13065_1 [Eumeta japonica]|uniref:Uncharacterized protein n=1 Tax=Eumeta variegata TaxID=151549 RepID=A0A4C1VJY6_EUMVA|nr:hypothetical protein EVAR_13065_1 [Eumeta japonica]